MTATVNVLLYKSKTLANGEHPLMIRVCKDNKKKYKSLGISLNAKYWNFETNTPRRNCPNVDHIRQIISDKISEYQKQVIEFKAEQKNYTAKTLMTALDNEIVIKSVEEFYLDVIEKLLSKDKIGNAKIYRESYASIKNYYQGKDLDFLFEDIDISWLKSYEKWLIEGKRSEITISLLFRTLRSTFNKAIEAKIVKKEHYPFNAFKISKYNTKTKKRAITKEEIKRIIDIDLSQGAYLMQFTRDVFIFSYLHGGINLTDIANLKSTDLQSNRICYIRQKTNQEITIPLLPIGQKIIDRWKLQNSEYLFPILNEKTHITAQQKFNRIHKYNGHINKHLKEIAKLVQIEINLTTYVARHSFATVLKRSGVNTAIISESLGHSSEKVTQIYLDSFENKQIDDAMKNLL